MGPSAEVHCAARAADRVQRSRNVFSSITMTKPVACRGTPLYRRVVRASIDIHVADVAAQRSKST